MDEKVRAIVDRLLVGEALHEQVDGYHGRAIADALIEGGFAGRRSLSACSKASFEQHLERDGLKVDIVVADFFGTFTQVSAFR